MNNFMTKYKKKIGIIIMIPFALLVMASLIVLTVDLINETGWTFIIAIVLASLFYFGI